VGKRWSGVDVWSAGASFSQYYGGDLVTPSQQPVLGQAPTNVYRCTYSGVTGTVEPTWPTTPMWTRSTAFTLGNQVINGNGYQIYTCTQAGTSGIAGGPTGTGTGIVDGGCKWDYASAAPIINDGTCQWQIVPFLPPLWTAATSFNLGDVCAPSPATGHSYIAVPLHGAPSGATAGSQPTWPTTIGAAVDDGGVRWIMLPDNTDGGVSVESIMTGIMWDNMTRAGIIIPGPWVPNSPLYWRNPLIVPQSGVLEAMRNLALEIGWDIRLRWDANVPSYGAWGAWRLCLYCPNRSASSADFTLSADEYVVLPRAAVNIATVRNVIKVGYGDPADLWSDGNPKRKSVTVSDAPSIAKYGRKYMEITAGSNNNCNTAFEASDLANCVLADLKDPLLDVEVQGPYRWNVELGDMVTLTANWYHFTGDQLLAVYGWKHTLSAKTCETVLSMRGRPSLGVMRWHEQASQPGSAPPGKTRQPSGPGKGSIVVQPGLKGTIVSFTPPGFRAGGKPRPGPPHGGEFNEAEIHLSTSSGFTPSSATLVQRGKATAFSVTGLQPATQYYGKILTIDSMGQRSPPSDQFSVKTACVDLATMDTSLTVLAGMRNNLAQTVALNNGTFTYNLTLFDTTTGWFPGGIASQAGGQISIPTGAAGLYFIWGKVGAIYNGFTGDIYSIAIRKNGIASFNGAQMQGGSGVGCEVLGIMTLAVGDYIDLCTLCTSQAANLSAVGVEFLAFRLLG